MPHFENNYLRNLGLLNFQCGAPKWPIESVVCFRNTIEKGNRTHKNPHKNLGLFGMAKNFPMTQGELQNATEILVGTLGLDILPVEFALFLGIPNPHRREKVQPFSR